MNPGTATPQDGQEGTIARLSRAIDAYPAGYRGNPLHLLFLEDAVPIPCAQDYLVALDRPFLCEERREYLPNAQLDWPFPVLVEKGRPDPYQLSEALFRRFDTAPTLLPVQRDIGRILSERAVAAGADLVALIVVDGLSYFDLPDKEGICPCLVDGVTITDYGYLEALGKPSVSQRLFMEGYRSQLGLTYFDTNTNALAGDLYEVFGTSQVVRISTFAEALDHIRAARIARGYVQITMPGLDALCHQHHDEPPRGEYLRQILERFDSLVDCLAKDGRRVLACLTADHGILWRECLDGRVQVVSDLLPEDCTHPRYVLGSVARAYAHVKSCRGQAYSLLKMPYLTRPLRRNEWGVHGGISAWESIVPLIVRESWRGSYA